MKVIFDYLDQLDFRIWWIKENAKGIVKHPLLTPTHEDYDAYILEKMEEEVDLANANK